MSLGIKDIATMSDGASFGGEALNAYRLKRHKVRKSLQTNAHTGSRTTRKNARRALKRLSGKERRYQKDINHRISKHITGTAKANTHAIALEDLKGIRDRTNKRLRKSQRGLHNSWAFYQLQMCVRFGEGARFQNIGIIPDVEVKPTIQGMIAGRDEVLKKGLEVLKVDHENPEPV